jgi:hypothetical protein
VEEGTRQHAGGVAKMFSSVANKKERRRSRLKEGPQLGKDL